MNLGPCLRSSPLYWLRRFGQAGGPSKGLGHLLVGTACHTLCYGLIAVNQVVILMSAGTLASAGREKWDCRFLENGCSIRGQATKPVETI